MDFPNKPRIPLNRPIVQPEISANFDYAMPAPPRREMPKAINPDDPPWNSFAGIGAWLGSIFLMLLLPMVGILIYAIVLLLGGLSKDELLAQLKPAENPTFILVNIIAVIPAHILTILGAWMIITKIGKQPFFESLGWNWFRQINLDSSMRFFCFASCILAAILLFSAGIVVTQIFGAEETEMTRMLQSSRNALYLTAFLATFTAPLVEEVIYRGIVYSALQRSIGKIGGVAIVTFLFTLVHVPQYWQSLVVISMIFLLSLVLTTIRAWTENLLPCVVIHTVFNGIQAFLLVLSPETTAPEKSVTTGFVHFYNFFQ